ncbi:YcjX family protein [Paraglaciecola aquimarina]|uniref:YcjX family protein n=1 Tax=Paraglaciecola algarum TaxID=3050085 RepID=A0ABS9D1U5_9ALTE|nr:YcjX family protein [Paraglaciecola sp. G1-23]MCF2946878.1 YcjX family protein [Paraglaciecola sp. G1-23]
MPNSFFKHPQFLRTKQHIKQTAERLIDQHVSLAVTGLSGSGKTAFITSLVNQLIEANEQAHLPFFSVLSESRLIGVKRDIQPDLTFNRFAYEDAMANLRLENALWPDSTRGISQVRLKIKFKRAKGLSQYITEDTTLTLDITDYPGEWLLDLPLLNMNYLQWNNQCAQELLDPKRRDLAAEFMLAASVIDYAEKADELVLKNVASLYKNYLVACQNQGYQLLQPGRFILPGELADAPVLQFFPIPSAIINQQNLDIQQPVAESYADVLASRFNHYTTDVIKPFYQNHFKRFDRQVILVDCLSALNRGYDSFHDLQKALDWLMGSFEYGSSNILSRLFKPKIDKLVFAASKADHITPDQQVNLVKLLDSMLHQARKQLQFDGVTTESTAIAAIRASQSGLSQIDGEEIPVLKGSDNLGQTITLYPGEVPTSCPPRDFWSKQGFEYPKFSPPKLQGAHSLPHIRMDQLLDFLIGDKMS